MKNFILSFSLLSLVACQGKIDKQSGDHSADGDTSRQKEVISALLDSFNVAAANADFDGYFGFYTDNAIFIGTDATEHWNKQAFMKWAKPAFGKKKTWNFKAMKRNIYFWAKPGYCLG